MKTIKQHLSELPEPYNWLALEECKKYNIDLNIKFTRNIYALGFLFICSKHSGNFDMADFYEGLIDNLQHLGK